MEVLIQYINSLLIPNILTVTDGLMITVVFVLLMSLYSLNRQRLQYKEQQLSIRSLQRDLHALANAAVGVGGRVIELERQQRGKRPVIVPVEESVQTQTPVYATPTPPVEYYNASNQPYEQAIRMAQTGSNTQDIVNVCGLSESEAELVSMMHRLDKAS